jgi:L-seryl-tRNA(Ser) seleniumtransferase
MTPIKINQKNKILLKNIPSVPNILDEIQKVELDIDIKYIKIIIRKTIEEYRNKIKKNESPQVFTKEVLYKQIKEDVQKKLHRLKLPLMKKVINGTGIILHTNLGRAPFSDSAKKHLSQVIENYCNLEIDLTTGKRGDRTSIVEEILTLVTGAEAAVVVNNNAAAIFLSLNSLCRRKEVPVSRGELVEIGGSFRMPEVMKASGAKMVEVGTTNKTTLRDYELVLSERTAAILKVHTSNYRILGFTESAEISELVEMAHRKHLPLIYDMGSGVIEDLRNWDYPHEPFASEYINAGVDVITFSGDKVLGGPQAGIIIGKKIYIEKIKRNHLLRALRCDKVTYGLLDSTLRLYLNPANLPKELPVAEILTTPLDELYSRAENLHKKLNHLPLKVEIINTYSQMGSGALPLEKIPSIAVSISPQKISVTDFSKKLRLSDPAVVGYIENEKYLLNLRTIRDDELDEVVNIILQIF